MARDAALALDYAHGEGVLHRDVKPSNLLLDPTGRLWLTGFGLAKAEGSDDLTRSGDFVGTVRYMAPERFKGWADPRSDVYGLGITLHELLTLRPAFAERDRARLLRRVASEEPPAPRRVDRSIPRDLETIVLKAIAKEPAQRYGSARAIAQDLDRFLEGLPVEARRSHWLARLGRWCARNPLPAALAAAVLLLLAAVAAVSSLAAFRLTGEQVAGQEKPRAAYLAEASALRASSRPGSRFEALESLRKAAAIRAGADLVDEALASLAQIELRAVKTWTKKPAEVFSISPDGSTVALVSPGGEISLRTSADGRELCRLAGPGFHAAYCRSQFSRDGRYLAVRYEQGNRREWRVWDLDHHVVSAEIKDGTSSNCVDFSPDMSWVALGVKNHCLRLVDLATGRTMGEVGQGMEVSNVAIHPGGWLIAFSSSRTRKVHIYDRKAERIIRSFAGIEHQPFVQVAWHPDGRTLAAVNKDHRVYLYNAETGERSRLLQGHWAEAVWVQFSPGGFLLASRGWDPAVRFWDAGSDRHISTSHGPLDGNFGGDDRWYCTTFNESVVLWELTFSLPAYTLFGHDLIGRSGMVAKHPESIALAPGGRLAATCGDDGVRLEVGPAQRLTELEDFRCLTLGDGDRRIAVIHEVTHVHVFDPTNQGSVVHLKSSDRLRWVDLSSDGAWAAGAGIHGTEVQVWNAREGTLARRLPGGSSKCSLSQIIVGLGRAILPTSEARGRSRYGTEYRRGRVTKLGGKSAGITLQEFKKDGTKVKFDPTGAHLGICTKDGCTLWRTRDWEPAWRIQWEDGPSFYYLSSGVH